MHAHPIHLVATLTGCNLVAFAPDNAGLDEFMDFAKWLLVEHGFTVVSETSHFFAPHAATGDLCLAESHLSFHSWPEDELVYIDLFACGRSRDPKQDMLEVLQSLATKVFKASDVSVSWFDR